MAVLTQEQLNKKSIKNLKELIKSIKNEEINVVSIDSTWRDFHKNEVGMINPNMKVEINIREKCDNFHYKDDLSFDIIMKAYEAGKKAAKGLLCVHEPTKNISPNLYNETQCKKCGEML